LLLEKSVNLNFHCGLIQPLRTVLLAKHIPKNVCRPTKAMQEKPCICGFMSKNHTPVTR
jgi:hypothetical protein